MIAISGDTHGEWRKLNVFINSINPELLIVCGDFGYWPREKEYDLKKLKTGRTKILFCDGNHEDHHSLRRLVELGVTEVSPSVFYMKRGSVYTLPDGRRILFMGGANSTDKDQRIIGYDWFPEETISWADMENLPDPPIDIVISHTCPNEFYDELVDRGDNDPSRVALSIVLDKYKPALWFFGHFHMSKSRQYGVTRWTALNRIREQGWWTRLQ